jgi:hypothetical protein
MCGMCKRNKNNTILSAFQQYLFSQLSLLPKKEVPEPIIIIQPPAGTTKKIKTTQKQPLSPHKPERTLLSPKLIP